MNRLERWIADAPVTHFAIGIVLIAIIPAVLVGATGVVLVARLVVGE